MKRMLASFTTVIAIASLSVCVGTGTAEAKSKKPKVYKSCSKLHKDYPNGIAKSGAVDVPKAGYKAVKNFKTNGAIFTANKKLDTDGDRIACEKIGAKKPVPPPPPYKAKIVLAPLAGNGSRTTLPFTTGLDMFGIAYTFDCTNYGMEGNFIVETYQGTDLVDISVNDLAMSGAGPAYVYLPKGTYHFSIISECGWQIAVQG